jgi:hypothetical protein
MTLFIGIMLAGILGGCAGINQTISPERQILFSDSGSGTGDFRNGRLEISYQYEINRNTVNVAGNFSYNWKYDSLNIWAVLVDSSGQVLLQRLVFSSGFRTGRTSRTEMFSESLELAPGAVGLSFTHSSTERRGRP